jgi:hypothetical protein
MNAKPQTSSSRFKLSDLRRTSPKRLRSEVYILAAFLSLIMPCLGDQVVQARTTGSQHIDFPFRFTSSSRQDTDIITVNSTFDRFNTNLGSLFAAKVKYATRFDPIFTGTIVALGVAGVNASIDCQHKLAPPGAASSVLLDLFFNSSGTFTVHPPVTVVTLDYSAQSGDTGLVNIPGTALGLYQGAGQVVLPLSINCVQQATISTSGMNYQFNSDYEITVTLEYDYIPFAITQFQVVGNGQATIAWNTKPNITYQIQANGSLDSTNWMGVTNVTASSSNIVATIPVSMAAQNFYRIAIFTP